eukprot:7346237-Pyramimonas_sp.AAC.1
MNFAARRGMGGALRNFRGEECDLVKMGTQVARMPLPSDLRLGQRARRMFTDGRRAVESAERRRDVLPLP